MRESQIVIYVCCLRLSCVYVNLQFDIQGLWAILILSLSGVVFLSIIAHLLKSDSVYIKVGRKNEGRKEILSEGVIGAVVMYALTACVALYYLYKSKLRKKIDSQTLEHLY